MPRRASRSSAGPKRESSPALIIALVFMVLIALVLGVFLYLEKDKTVQAQKQAKDKVEETQKLQSENNTLRDYYMASLRSWLDSNSVGQDEYEKLKDPEGKYRNQSVQGVEQWYAALRTKVVGNPNSPNPTEKVGLIGPWNPSTGKPATDYINRYQTLSSQLAAEIKRAKDKEAELQTTLTEFKNYRDQWNATVQANAIKKAQEEAQKQHDAALAQKDATITALNEKINEVSKEVELALQKDRDQLAGVRKRLQEDYEKRVIELTTDFRRQRELLEGSKVVQLDQPRGKITRVERGDTVYINLGTDERVTPGLTFSVYGTGPGGKPDSDPKAKIEVVSILGPKLSLARVTQMYLSESIRGQYVDPTRVDPWVKDPREFYRARNPVLTGDLIYNPVWDPNRKVRVALAGVFDLDGDGTDDIDTFRRMLRDMNAEVVAYIDAKGVEPRLVGALDYKTDFLILGGMPDTAGEKIIDRKGAQAGGLMVLLAGQVQDEAVKKGIEIIALPRFLTRIGYSSIRVAQRSNGNGRPAAPAVKPEKPDGN